MWIEKIVDIEYAVTKMVAQKKGRARAPLPTDPRRITVAPTIYTKVILGSSNDSYVRVVNIRGVKKSRMYSRAFANVDVLFPIVVTFYQPRNVF